AGGHLRSAAEAQGTGSVDGKGAAAGSAVVQRQHAAADRDGAVVVEGDAEVGRAGAGGAGEGAGVDKGVDPAEVIEAVVALGIELAVVDEGAVDDVELSTAPGGQAVVDDVATQALVGSGDGQYRRRSEGGRSAAGHGAAGPGAHAIDGEGSGAGNVAAAEAQGVGGGMVVKAGGAAADGGDAG